MTCDDNGKWRINLHCKGRGGGDDGGVDFGGGSKKTNKTAA
jgi:hypothetical protein